MKRFLALSWSCIFALLISSLAFPAEVRKLGVNDLEFGIGTTTSPGGKVVTKIPIGPPTDNTFLGVHDVVAYGAVLGTGKSTAIKNANAAAIAAAFAAIVAAQGGTILIPGVVEVGANVLNFGSATSTWYRLNVIGLGPDTSEIVSESTTNVIDLVGRNYLSMRNLSVSSSTAQVGILMGRTATAGSCNKNDFTNVWVTGAYSIATIASAAAESSMFYGCNFRNTGTAPVYWTATKNAMGATSGNGTIITESNSDIHHFGTHFVNEDNDASQIVVRISNAANINFYGGLISSSSSSGGKLVQLDSDTSTWYGLANFNGVLFEGGTGFGVYFATTGIAYYNLNFDSCYFNLFNAGAKVFGYVDNTAEPTQLRFAGNRISVGYSNVDLQNIVDGEVYNFSEEGTVTVVAGTYIRNTNIRAKTITWGAGSYGLGGWFMTGNDNVYGIQIFGPQPNSSSGDVSAGTDGRGSVIRIAPQDAAPIAGNKVIGGLYMVDSSAWAALGPTAIGAEPHPVYWDGTQYRGMAPIPATPASATATCAKGAIAFDNNYLYYCVTSNNWRRASFVSW